MLAMGLIRKDGVRSWAKRILSSMLWPMLKADCSSSINAGSSGLS